jgi:hypothetical protein
LYFSDVLGLLGDFEFQRFQADATLAKQLSRQNVIFRRLIFFVMKRPCVCEIPGLWTCRTVQGVPQAVHIDLLGNLATGWTPHMLFTTKVRQCAAGRGIWVTVRFAQVVNVWK